MKKVYRIINNQDLKPHENIRVGHFNRLLRRIKKDGFINNPIIADKNTLVILDGHHRFQVLKFLGYASSPVYLC